MWGKGRMMENVRYCWGSAEYGDSTRRAQGGRGLQQWDADPQQTVLSQFYCQKQLKRQLKICLFLYGCHISCSKVHMLLQKPSLQAGRSQLHRRARTAAGIDLDCEAHLFVCTNGQGNIPDWDSQTGLYVNSFNQEYELMVEYQLDLVRSLTHTPR